MGIYTARLVGETVQLKGRRAWGCYQRGKGHPRLRAPFLCALHQALVRIVILQAVVLHCKAQMGEGDIKKQEMEQREKKTQLRSYYDSTRRTTSVEVRRRVPEYAGKGRRRLTKTDPRFDSGQENRRKSAFDATLVHISKTPKHSSSSVHNVFYICTFC